MFGCNYNLYDCKPRQDDKHYWFIGNYYASGKKASHWKRRGITKRDGITIRVFEREVASEAIKPETIVVDLPNDYLVIHSTDTEIQKIEFLSLAEISKLKIKVSCGIGSCLN